MMTFSQLGKVTISQNQLYSLHNESASTQEAMNSKRQTAQSHQTKMCKHSQSALETLEPKKMNPHTVYTRTQN